MVLSFGTGFGGGGGGNGPTFGSGGGSWFGICFGSGFGTGAGFTGCFGGVTGALPLLFDVAESMAIYQSYNFESVTGWLFSFVGCFVHALVETWCKSEKYGTTKVNL